jgi:hypothetical protein
MTGPPPATVLLEPPTECPTGELPWVRSFIAACKFRAATQGNLGGRPVGESPHSYQVRGSLPLVLQPVFDRFSALIARCGYTGSFLGRRYVYLDVPDEAGESWRFWVSPSWYPPGDIIVNRASNLAAPCEPPPPPPQPTLWEEPTP